MPYLSKYAIKKFEILNKYKVFLRQEEVEDCINNPDREEKKGNYFFAKKEKVGVVYKVEDGMKKVITFYPVLK